MQDIRRRFLWGSLIEEKYLEGKVLHKENGPAWIYYLTDGTWFFKKWYKHGKLHREDGPAVEFMDGHKEWHINGKFDKSESSN